MPYLSFEDLRVYQLAEALSDEVWGIVMRWDFLAKDTVGKQLIRSADSIGANIAEGCGRWSYQDNRRFVRMARGSLNETRHWLRRAYRRELLTDQQTSVVKQILDDLAPCLNGYLRSISEAEAGRRKPTPEPANNGDTTPAP